MGIFGKKRASINEVASALVSTAMKDYLVEEYFLSDYEIFITQAAHGFGVSNRDVINELKRLKIFSCERVAYTISADSPDLQSFPMVFKTALKRALLTTGRGNDAHNEYEERELVYKAAWSQHDSIVSEKNIRREFCRFFGSEIKLTVKPLTNFAFSTYRPLVEYCRSLKIK